MKMNERVLKLVILVKCNYGIIIQKMKEKYII